MENRDFGALVKAYRKQRGWTQEELANRWGYARTYVTQVEAGKRKLDRFSQISRIVEILDIPQEKLNAIGYCLPEPKERQKSNTKADSEILQMLLAPGRDMVKLSYMMWLADQYPMIEKNLHDLTINLGVALTSYRGEFLRPAQQLLVYTHQMLGKIAFDCLDYARASGHFSEMIDLGQELNDVDTIALGMIRRGDILRKRAWYETALRCFEAVKPYASDTSIRGLLHMNIARLYYFLADEQNFLRSINLALEIAAHIKESHENAAYWFNLDVALQFQASGFTALQKPERAIEIYKEIDRLHTSRPLRDQGAYTIEKARAYLESGNFDKGIRLSLRGLQLATEYRSKRHVTRLEATCKRLLLTPLGKDKRIQTLQDALIEVQRDQANW